MAVVVFGRGAIGVLLVAQFVVVRETLDRCLFDSRLPEAELSHPTPPFVHFSLRPSVTSAFLACTKKMHEANFWFCFLLGGGRVSPKLLFSIGLFEHNVHKRRDPNGDPEWPIDPIR